jgi:hypothetical protein
MAVGSIALRDLHQSIQVIECFDGGLHQESDHALLSSFVAMDTVQTDPWLVTGSNGGDAWDSIL